MKPFNEGVEAWICHN